MSSLGIRRNNKGFTLIEIIFAVTVSAVIMTSVALLLSLSLKGYEIGSANDELSMHARIALDRISTELRHATNLKVATVDQLEFETLNYIDDDRDTVETIQYVRMGGPDELIRTVNLSGTNIVAGGAEGIQVTQFDPIPVKMNAGSVAATTEADAQAVRLRIDLQDSANNTFSANTTVVLRN